ncbi:MAG: DegT/DnrJ/EryC1/StrS family aminotransferase [Clostridia bacterium]|jgi:perosamine synthetase|nr:DegT/DnrJ/EryC1/StrS family aminotransferase [Clostridiaceae bacterium]
MSDQEKLAIYGGTPVRQKPMPARKPFGEEEIREVTEAILTQNLFYTKGNKTTQFEAEFAQKYGVKYAITCSSGTAAVHMAIAALDANPGDEVITAPVTDFGTIAGLLFQGIIPVFADWKENTFTMDPEDIERKITDRTKAIIVVHLFGNPCDMDRIMDIADRHGLKVIEDCCQAYFTYYKGRLAGTIGDMGCFSMQQSKHLTAGEGGIVITNRDDLAMRASLFRDKGWENRHQWGPRSYSFLGLNYRMNDLSGAVALAQLKKTENVVNTMNRLGDLLTERIKDVPGIVAAPVTEGAKHSYWQYPIKFIEYDAVQFVKALVAEGIPFWWGYTVDPIYLCTDALTEKRTFGSSSYPFSLRDQPIEYKRGLCPVAEAELRSIGVMRIYENWTEEDIQDVAKAIHKVAKGLKNE